MTRQELAEIEKEMLQWMHGEFSHWNYFRASDVADAGAWTIIADSLEVIKRAAILQAYLLPGKGTLE